MDQNQKRQSDFDTQRGIQKTNARFEDFANKRLLSEQILETKRRNIEEKDAPEQTTDEEEQIYEQQQVIQRMKVAQQHMRVQKGKSARGPKGLGSMMRFFGVGILLWVALFQIIFGIFSAVGFGLEVAKNEACGTVAGKLVCGVASAVNSGVEFLTGIDLSGILAFQNIGWLFWGLIFFITVIVLVSYTTLFLLQKIPAYHSGTALLAAGVCVSLNLVPFFNIVPWIQIWAGFWIIYGVIPKSA